MIKQVFGLLIGAILLSSCATVQQQIGKVALKVMTKKEADFNNIAAIGKYQANIYAANVGISTLGTEDWEAGEHLVGVQFVKPDGKVGVIALDGTVTIDGIEAKSYGGGAYFARFPADNETTKQVVVTSSNGEQTEFQITPPPSIKIARVNGATQNATIDVNAPLEIEIEYASEAEGKRVMVALITKAVGAKGFAYFQSTVIDNKILVPADAFKHKHIAGGGPTGKDVTNWATGENHLQISLVEHDRSETAQPFPYFKKEMTSFDTVPVTVTGNTEGRAWVKVNGNSEEESGTFKYSASSTNAWYARPLNTNIDRIGISSLSVSGTLYKQEVEVEEKDNYLTGYREIITTTTTFQFPELDDQYWNQFLENMYSDLTSMLSNEYGASIVDVNQITSHPVYDEFYTPQDENNQEYIAKKLRDTKRLIPTRLGEILSDRSTILIADGGTTPRLVRDLNMDALMDVVINYQVAGGENNTIVLLPNISYRVTGQTQAFDGNTNVWLEGTIQGPGVPFSESEFSDLNALNRIGQKDVILKLINQSIKELTEKQAEFGYDEIWKLAINQ